MSINPSANSSSQEGVWSPKRLNGDDGKSYKVEIVKTPLIKVPEGGSALPPSILDGVNTEDIITALELFIDVASIPFDIGLNVGQGETTIPIKITVSDIHTYYEDDVPRSRYSQGLPKEFIKYTFLKEDNPYLVYLNSALEKFKFNTLFRTENENKMNVPVPFFRVTYGEGSDKTTSSFSARTSIEVKAHSWLWMDPMALPITVEKWKYIPTIKLPLFNAGWLDPAIVRPRYRLYNLMDLNVSEINEIIKTLFCVYILKNLSFESFFALAAVSSKTFGMTRIREKIKGTLIEDYINDIWRKVREIRYIAPLLDAAIDTLMRAVQHNVSFNDIEYVCLPVNEAKKYYDKYVELQYYKEDWKKLQEVTTSMKCVFGGELESTTYTLYAHSGLVTNITHYSNKINSDGSMESFNIETESTPIGNTIKSVQPIKRRIVVRDGSPIEAKVYIDGDKVKIESGDSPNEENEENNSLLISTSKVYKTIKIPTTNWNDAIKISQIMPGKLRHVSESYTYETESVDTVTSWFTQMTLDPNIASFSIEYDGLKRRGNYSLSYVESF